MEALRCFGDLEQAAAVVQYVSRGALSGPSRAVGRAAFVLESLSSFVPPHCPGVASL